jgi:hypothetical protein
VRPLNGTLHRLDPLWEERLIIIMIAMAMARQRAAPLLLMIDITGFVPPDR